MYLTNVKGAKAKQLNESYKYMTHPNGEGLYSIYNKPSQAKIRAYNSCLELYQELGGFNLRLCGNSSVFSFAFKYEDKETGVLKLCYITPSYNYSCDLQ